MKRGLVIEPSLLLVVLILLPAANRCKPRQGIEATQAFMGRLQDE
jgi:hypothetical protein